MKLTQRQQEWLFYSLLTIIVLVSVVMIVALVRHFVLGDVVEYIEWILVTFVAEIIACFVLAWKVVLGSAELSAQTNPTVIEKMDYPEDASDRWVQLKNAGRQFLDLGRNRKYQYIKRKRFLNRAVEILEKIPAGEKAYPAALYNLGTAYRELRKFDTSLRYYVEAESCLESELRDVPREEMARRKSDILFMKGRVFDAKGEMGQAKKLYEESWTTYPNDYGVVFNLYEICKETGEDEEATVWYSLLKRFPEHRRVEGHDDQSVN